MNVESFAAHGWLPDNKVDWIDEAFPTDFQELLLELSDTECSLDSKVGIDSEDEDESSSDEDLSEA